MKNRLHASLCRITERANGALAKLTESSTATGETEHQDAQPACSVAEAYAIPPEARVVHPAEKKSGVAQVADFFLPGQSEEKKVLDEDKHLFIKGVPAVEECATCATAIFEGHLSEAVEVDGGVFVGIETHEEGAPTSQVTGHASDEPCKDLKWTHVTAKGVSLVNIASGRGTEIVAATPAIIARSITDARRAGVIKTHDLSIQQAMWRAICAGHLLVCMEHGIFLANPAHQQQFFLPVPPSL